MLEIKSIGGQTTIEAEGNCWELLDEVVNSVLGVVDSLEGKMNEDDSNVFCLGILMALSTVWADRPGFAEKMETVKIGVKPKNYKGVVT